jgi:amino acid transporter
MKKQNKKSEDGLGLLSIVWIGFNFIAGITCATAFKKLVWDATPGEGANVGLNLLWIDVLEGTIAFICAWSFAKLVRVHPTANGGLSQYARTGFGKYWGLVGGLLNYMSLPLIVSTMVVSTLKSNCGDGSINLVAQWGDWSELYLDLIGLAVFLISVGIVFLGVKKYKYFSNIVGVLGWILMIGIIIFAIGAFAFNGMSSINFLAKNAPLSNVSGKSFANTFVAIFFSFAGIETFITSGQTIKDRAKNMPIGISLIMIFVTAFYVIFTFLVIGACTLSETTDFGSNGAISIFGTWDIKFDTAGNFQNAGAWLVIILTLVIRFNSLVNINMFGGLTLEPLAKQGFVSKRIAEQSEKTGLPWRALLITALVYLITIILFLFIPDIIHGVTGDPSPFTYAILASVSSIVMISIYVLSIATCLKQYFTKKMKLNIVEVIAFILVLGFMGFLIVMYFWTEIVDNYAAGTTQTIISATIQLIFILSIVATSFGLFYGFHKKYLAELQQNDKATYQEIIDYEKETYRLVEPQDGGVFHHKEQKNQKLKEGIEEN